MIYLNSSEHVGMESESIVLIHKYYSKVRVCKQVYDKQMCYFLQKADCYFSVKSFVQFYGWNHGQGSKYRNI